MVGVRDKGYDSAALTGVTGYSPLEQQVAHRTAALHGFMDDDGSITGEGHKWLNSNLSLRGDSGMLSVGGDKDAIMFAEIYAGRDAATKTSFEVLQAILPETTFAAMCEIVGEGHGHEAFERKHQIPQRSAKLLVAEGATICNRVLRAVT
ncbi:hypothetical protein QO034_18945 [Sedimentitalea sp. JM2-8]|uniref:Uncharacterized protein n=2 Tax=Sedimentitalea xiamensis TaxID=3050037 RepID=A0ABT7FJL1_9RHOB|nr:hypothetical protein [Sedimentitalea xiamensis]